MAAPTYTTVRDIARKEIGVFEDPYGSNRQKYGEWYGWNGVAWCAIFMCWVFYKAGGLSLLGGKTASVWVLADRFRKMGRYGTTPRVGALAIYSNYSHVSLVTAASISSGVFTDVSGNTSAGAGSISNGGVVAEKKRSASLVIGYCYPAYAAPPAASPKPVIKPTTATPVNLIVDGVVGPKTYTAINRWSGRGNTSAWDVRARKALQRKVGVAQDGIVGRRTVTALQKVVGVPTRDRDGLWGRQTTTYLQRYLNAR